MGANIERLSPADIFQEGIEYLYQYFKPSGYKLLKSNVIKKKRGSLSYEVSFSSSHYNYIDYKNHCGSVAINVNCNIRLNKEIVFAFRFSNPMSTYRNFELLSDELRMYRPLMDVIWLEIEKHFLSVIKGFEENPIEQLKTIGLAPEIKAEDYSWLYWLERPLVELLGDADTLAQYDANCEEYNSLCNKVLRNNQEYIYHMKNNGNINPEVDFTAKYLFDLCQRIYDTLCIAGIEDLWVQERYKTVKKMDANDLIELAIAVGGFSKYITSDTTTSPKMRQADPELAYELDEFWNKLYLNK